MTKLFDDADFKHLVRIYYNNSDIFKKFLNYVNNGKFITIRKLTNNVSDNYLHEMNQLKELGVLKSDNEILEILQKFNGHLNLSLCTLLAN